MTLRFGYLPMFVAAALLIGCHGHQAAKPSPATSPTTDASPAASTAVAKPGAFQSKGIRLNYPGEWQPKKNPDYELMLITGASNNDEPRITLDVPDLPPHLPFMIQMSRIEHDYLDDLKKQHADLKIDEDGSPSMSNTIARRIRSHWNVGGKQHDDVVLLMIHASAVYILDLRADDARIKTVLGAFDSIRQSIQWLK